MLNLSHKGDESGKIFLLLCSLNNHIIINMENKIIQRRIIMGQENNTEPKKENFDRRNGTKPQPDKDDKKGSEQK